MSNPLNDFGLKIFMDRYAQKDTTKATLAVEDTVVVCVDQKTRQREVGKVLELIENPGNKPRVKIKLLDGTETTQGWDDVDKPLEVTAEQTMARTARGAAEVEIEEKRGEWEEKFKWLLDEWRFVPGGRILAAAGTEQKLSLFNCLSRETLVHLDTGIVEIGTLSGWHNVLSYGGVYRPAEFKSYGVQQLWAVELENGTIIHATAEHEWPVSKIHGGEERVFTRNLVGRRILVNPSPKPEIDADFYTGVRNGIVYGDGTLSNKGKNANVYLFGEKMELEPYFDGFGTSHNHAEATDTYPEHIRVIGLDPLLKSLPAETASAAYWRGFIVGLMATDGNVDNRGSCSLFSSSEDDLRYIADNMAKAGFVAASIKMTRQTSPYDGSDKPVYTLRLVKSSVSEADLIRKTQVQNFVNSPSATKKATIRVASVAPTSRIEEVYCCNEPETHTLTVSHGYLTGNCYVIGSPKDSRAGILHTLGEMTEIMSRGGGVGVNLSSLRPRYAYVKGVNGRSSGSVSWGGLFSFTTGLIEQGGCFAPYTRILTDKGNIPVLEIVDRMDKGEKFKAWTHKGWRAITDKFRNGRKTVHRMTTDQGYTLDITGEHKVMTMDESGTFGLVKLDKLSAGDSVMILRGSVPNDIPYVALSTDVPKDIQGQDVRLPAELDEDLAYVLGYYVGNGNIANSSERAPHAVTFAVPHDRPETLQNLTETLERLFARRVSHLEGDGAMTRVAVCSRQLVRYFDANELTKAGSISARSPEQIFRSRRSVIEAFIGGWFAADGCNRGAKGGFGLDTISYQGAMDLQKLLQMLGIVSRIATQTREAEGWNTIYRVVVSGSYMCSEMAKWLGDYTNKINDRPLPVKNHAYTWPVNFNKTYRPSFTAKFDRVMPPWNGTTSQAAIAHVRDNTELLTEDQSEHFKMLDNCVHDTIASIEKIGAMDTYDLTVDEVHTMSGDGVYVSNSRRGALMLLLNDWHPDVVDFIDAKREAGKITNANISVAISDKFMEAVFADADWNLVFPNTSAPEYATEWNGDLQSWVGKGLPVEVYKTVKAKALWQKIIESAWASAEPGVFFLERYNKESNSNYFAPIVACNPCAEQGLPQNGCCNLGALNLSKFVDIEKKVVQWDDLRKAVTYAVRFLDNVVDMNLYFMESIEKQQLGERRVGLGIMGLAEMMLRLEIRYGSPKGNEFVEELSKFLAVSAYEASSDNAAEKGSFPEFVADELLRSGFAKRLPAELRKRIRKQGLRNVTLLTVAPTGTTGTMVDTSTGIEPYYSWTYFRKSRLGLSEIEVDVVAQWRTANPEVKDLPEHFVTAMDLTPEEHVSVQAAMQKWIDSSISKTCNVPSSYTVDQTRELYELMYKLGCKGGTIYRDGSRDEQVLMLKKDEPAEAKPVKAETPKLRKRPAGVLRTLNGKKMTHLGSCYTNVTLDRSGEPLEIFVTSGKAGSDVSAMAEGLGRLASLVLSIPSTMSPQQRLALIAEQLEGIGGSDSVGFGKDKIKSIPDAVGKSVQSIVDTLDEDQNQHQHLASVAVNQLVASVEAMPVADHAKPKTKKRAPAPDMCPKCGQATYIREEGCMHCTSCGHSACG